MSTGYDLSSQDSDEHMKRGNYNYFLGGTASILVSLAGMGVLFYGCQRPVEPGAVIMGIGVASVGLAGALEVNRRRIIHMIRELSDKVANQTTDTQTRKPEE